VECAGRSGSFVSLLAPSDPRFGSLLASLSNSGCFPPNRLILIRILSLRPVIFRVFLRILPQLRDPPARRGERTWPMRGVLRP